MAQDSTTIGAFVAPSRRQLALLGLAVEGGMLVIAVVLGLFFGPPIVGISAFSPHACALGALAGGTLFLLAAVALDSPLGRNTRLRQDVDQLSGLFRAARPVDLVWMSALAGAGEEALFRGLLLHHGTQWFGLPMGILLSSLLFGLVHAISPAYVVFAAALGALMCGLYLWSGNLAVPIVAHGVYDLAALAYLNYLRPGAGRATP